MVDHRLPPEIQQIIDGMPDPPGRRRRRRANGAAESQIISPDDFYAYMPAHKYLFVPSRELWPKESVEGRLGKGMAAWLDQNRPIEQMTWMPGEGVIIRHQLISEGGFFAHDGATVFNLYRAPQHEAGDPTDVGPWVQHLYAIYPDSAEHIIAWFAHRVQRPYEKINHALVLGGVEGIGKDSIIGALKYAVGGWNFEDINQKQALGRFNKFLRSVVLRISEARENDVDRFQFYEHMKTVIAAPPDVHRIDEKHLREYYVPNICGVILTTNNKDGVHVPPDGRRHHVSWSERKKEEFTDQYWDEFWDWYEDRGLRNIAAYLSTYDLSKFNPKAPPQHTDAFLDIVNFNRPSEESEFLDALDAIGSPNSTTLDIIRRGIVGITELYDFLLWLNDRKNRRKIPHRMEAIGYLPVRNPDAAGSDGLWKIGNKRQAVYAKSSLSQQDRLESARRLVGSSS